MKPSHEGGHEWFSECDNMDFENFYFSHSEEHSLQSWTCDNYTNCGYCEGTANTKYCVSKVGPRKNDFFVEKRNARERNRVRAVNDAFAKLRDAIPCISVRRKRVSKVKTLQKAVQYIQELRNALESYH